MREPGQLTEHEAELINRLVEAYPGALGYTPDRDGPVLAVARELIDEGRIERTRVTDAVDPATGVPAEAMWTYRLADDYAGSIRRGAEEQADAARWN